MGPDAFFCRTLQIQLMLHRDRRQGQAAEPTWSQPRKVSITVTMTTNSLETDPAPERAASLEEPREQQQDQENQDDNHKYRYEPTPHFLTSLVRDFS